MTKWLTPASGYLSGYSHTLNPYKGCSFGCSYCYVRRLPVALFRGEPWGEWAEGKAGDPRSLIKEIRNAKKKGPVTIFCSSATDPYQPLEAREKLTGRLLEAMAEEPPDFILIQTRSPLVTRDIGLFRKLGRRVRVSLTVETDLEEVRRALTPAAPPIQARLNAIRSLRDAGVPAQAAVSPLLPHSAAFAELLAEAADKVVVDDYFRGDGSGGKRSEQLGMRDKYKALGWSDWYQPNALEQFVMQLRERFPEEAVGVSQSGFAPFIPQAPC